MSFGPCVNSDKANKQRQFQQADVRGRLFSKVDLCWVVSGVTANKCRNIGFCGSVCHNSRARREATQAFLLAAEDLKSVSTLINGDLLPPKAAKVIKMVACQGQSSTTASSLPT
jgi:hypothetical protein